MRLIDANLIEEIFKEQGYDYCAGVVYCTPTIDAEPIRHGKWIDVKGSNGKDYRKCSECLHTQDITGLLNYCPVCGAKMEGEEE